jgi:hypothetical protein
LVILISFRINEDALSTWRQVGRNVSLIRVLLKETAENLGVRGLMLFQQSEKGRKGEDGEE